MKLYEVVYFLGKGVKNFLVCGNSEREALSESKRKLMEYSPHQWYMWGVVNIREV